MIHLCSVGIAGTVEKNELFPFCRKYAIIKKSSRRAPAELPQNYEHRHNINQSDYRLHLPPWRIFLARFVCRNFRSAKARLPHLREKGSV